MVLYSIRLDEASEQALIAAARGRKVTRAVILREAIAEYGKGRGRGGVACSTVRIPDRRDRERPRQAFGANRRGVRRHRRCEGTPSEDGHGARGEVGTGPAQGPLILVDAGPLVALADRTDAHHAACLRALEGLRGPLGTVWPALTEAVYLVQRWPTAQMELLNLVETGALRILPFGRDDIPRLKALMTKYRDLPMDLADAALVRVAEREGIRTIFTIDRRDFFALSPRGARAIQDHSLTAALLRSGSSGCSGSARTMAWKQESQNDRKGYVPGLSSLFSTLSGQLTCV